MVQAIAQPTKRRPLKSLVLLSAPLVATPPDISIIPWFGWW
jgi:hypothetical protein